jgi:MFS family permease
MTGVALAFFVYSATAIALSPLMGVIGDRILERRRTIAIGCFLFSFVYYFSQCVPRYTVLLLEVLSATADLMIVPSVCALLFEESNCLIFM